MNRSFKFVLVLCLVSIFFVSSVVPCFALTSSDNAATYDYDSPFFCETVSVFSYKFSYNSRAGVSSTYIGDASGNIFGSQGWYSYQDSTHTSFSVSADVEDGVIISSNIAEFVMPSDFSSFPVLTVESPYGSIPSGVADVWCSGFYYSPGVGRVPIDFEYSTSVFHDDLNFYDRFDTSSSFALLGVPAGSYVSLRYTLDSVMFLDADTAVSVVTKYDDFDIFLDELSPDITIESVDVLSWLPTTIDSFLNVEILPGVDFGVLLLMVIAVPGLFAVLRMLGGGG